MAESKVIAKNYEIYSDGKLKNLKTNNFMKGSISKSGIKVSMNGKRYLLHRIVAETFLPNPNNYEFVIHINEDKTDNQIENLKWGNKHQYSGINFNKTCISTSYKTNFKSFSISAYGFEKCLQKAIQFKYSEEIKDGEHYSILPEQYFKTNSYKSLIQEYSDKYKNAKVMLKNKTDAGYRGIKINHYWEYIEYTREDEKYEYSASISYSSNSEALQHPKVITFKEALDKAVSLLHKKNLENDRPIYMTPEEYFETDVYKHIIEKYNVIE